MQKGWSSSRKLLTTIMLCYNKLDFVKMAAMSYINWNGLDPEDHEFVIWDQGAPYAGVKEYLDNLEKSDIPYLRRMGDGVNIGVGAALNRAIEYTDSEFVFKFDDDGCLLPLTLPVLMMVYIIAIKNGFPIGVLSADVVGTGKSTCESVDYELSPGIVLETVPCVGGGAVLVSRKVLGDVGPWRDDRLYGVEDGDFQARAYNKGYRNAYLKGAYYISNCRTEMADPEIDNWKLEYYQNKTDLPFDEWRKP